MWSAVFFLEFFRTGRRLRHHIARWAYAAWLLLMLLVGSAGAGRFAGCCCLPGFCLLPAQTFATPAEMLIFQQFLFTFLIVPPFSAGAITEEKGLGTLDQLLMSALTPWRIIAGKFAARVVQVGTVSLVGVPLLCWFGGLDWVPLAAVLVAEIGVLSCLAALSLLSSVWTRTTSSALLGAYAVSIALLLAVMYLGGPLRYLNPFSLIEPALAERHPQELGLRTLVSGGSWTVLTLTCLALASWRLRPAYLRQYLDQGQRRRSVRRVQWRPLISDDPLRWKERHTGYVSPLPLLRWLPRWVGVTSLALASIVISVLSLSRYLPTGVTLDDLADAASRGDYATVWIALTHLQPAEWGFFLQGSLSLLFLAVIVNLRAAGGISGEREKGTWDALLLAGMKPIDMVGGKLRGIMDSSLPYLLAYGIPALLISAVGGVLPFLATLGLLGIAWPLMYLSGAVALERSSRYPTPWKSTADSLVVTTLLIIGLIYGTLGLVLSQLMNLIIVPGAPLSGDTSTSRIVLVSIFLVYGTVLSWLLLRVARDYLRGTALTIKKAKGELPEKRYTLRLTDDEDDERPRPRRRRRDD